MDLKALQVQCRINDLYECFLETSFGSPTITRKWADEYSRWVQTI